MIKRISQGFIVLFLSIVNAQIVDIPDPIFKDVLVSTPCVDFDGDGFLDGDVDTNDDGEIQVSEAQAVVWLLQVADHSINSMEGIQSFNNVREIWCFENNVTELNLTGCSALRKLWCSYNMLINLNVSQNPNLETLWCFNNALTSLDVSNNPNLESLRCFTNDITALDISQNLLLVDLNCGNNDLTSLNISQNINLEVLNIWFNNISSIDVSQSPNIFEIDCTGNDLSELDLSNLSNLSYFVGVNNSLTQLNIQNGNNENLTSMYVISNPDLACIQVDDADFSNAQSCNAPLGWCKDEIAIYSEDCILAVSSFIEDSVIIFPNPIRNFLNIRSEFPIDNIQVYNMHGQLLKQSFGTNIDVSNLAAGLYFLTSQTGRGSVTKKFIKS